jgi:hypothetical protein
MKWVRDHAPERDTKTLEELDALVRRSMVVLISGTTPIVQRMPAAKQ